MPEKEDTKKFVKDDATFGDALECMLIGGRNQVIKESGEKELEINVEKIFEILCENSGKANEYIAQVIAKEFPVIVKEV